MSQQSDGARRDGAFDHGDIGNTLLTPETILELIPVTLFVHRNPGDVWSKGKLACASRAHVLLGSRDETGDGKTIFEIMSSVSTVTVQ